MKRSFTREQISTIGHGILSLVLFLIVLQLWLLTATLNAYLGGDMSVVWPAALASVVCFGCNLVLGRYLSVLEWPH